MRASAEARRSGYSLIELITVVAILILLAALVAPPAGSIIRAFNLSRQAQLLGDQMALAITLAILVLLTVLVVGFLSRATVERTSSAAYFDSSQSGVLVDQAIKIVRAQIDHATTRTGRAWASQPGMVRVFRENGTLEPGYKLYSDRQLVDSAVNVTTLRNSLNTWQTSPAHFTDLTRINHKLRSETPREAGWDKAGEEMREGRMRTYCPNRNSSPTQSQPASRKSQPMACDLCGLNEPVSVDGEFRYPIIDPRALDLASDGQPNIEGFEVSGAPGATANQPIPMPVLWLYVLENGEVVAPVNSDGTTAEIPGADDANPLVGRIAFWTDDETNKLNIYTASDGQFWDLPRVASILERDRMARNQPAQREFQRYSGHPATTSLRPALGYLFRGSANFDADFAEFAFALAPRVQQGGSLGGTVRAAAPVSLDNHRLYASPEEIAFGINPSGSRVRWAEMGQTNLDQSDLERTKFFLTARSNSPELNLFNLPRMAIWPINAGSKQPSTLDQLLAFCATINGQKYYLQRENPASATDDLAIDPQADGRGRNLQLFDYITDLLGRPFPGFGNTTFETKYPGEIPGLVTRIFDYIRSSNLYSTALGADAYTGPALVSTIGSAAGQVVPLEIGDEKGFGRLPTLSKAVLHFHVSGVESASLSVLPSSATSQPFDAPFTSGDLGRLSNLLETTGVGNPIELLTSAVIYFDTFDPNYGYIYPRYNFELECRFSGAWTVNGQPLGFPNATLPINRDHALIFEAKGNTWREVNAGGFLGGNLGPLWMMQNFTSLRENPENPDNSLGNNLVYPLASDRVRVHGPIALVQDPDSASPKPRLPDSTTLTDVINFSGGTVEVDLKVGNEVVQTFEFDFPPFTKPAPVYAAPDNMTHPPEPGETTADSVVRQASSAMDFKNRWLTHPHSHLKKLPGTGKLIPSQMGRASDPYYPDSGLIQMHDTIVSLEPAFGDKRLIAARKELASGLSLDPTTHFIPNDYYFTQTTRTAVDLSTDPYGHERSKRALELNRPPGRILDIVYGRSVMPDMPGQFSTGVPTAGDFPPDFDNGTFSEVDDAYINRADEGSAFDASATAFSWASERVEENNYDQVRYDNPTFFSPNRQMPSAVMFGSLPTGVTANHPWQTLLFRPDPGGHPGAESPPDFLLLDLFWMPVVEPYAISERFSSNGKVNMNYQILPFSYITRATGLLGVFQSQEILTVRNTEAVSGQQDAAIRSGRGALDHEYKNIHTANTGDQYSDLDFRRSLNLSKINGTLRTFEDKFSQNEIYISETQICAIPLIPEDAVWSADFESDNWDSRRLTGDNSREAPYAHLLPRLTTRSNTFTVHYRVQRLAVPESDQGTWDEDSHQVLAEERGSRTVERYIDPDDESIPDYAANPNATPTLDALYRWRTVANRRFNP